MGTYWGEEIGGKSRQFSYLKMSSSCSHLWGREMRYFTMYHDACQRARPTHVKSKWLRFREMDLRLKAIPDRPSRCNKLEGKCNVGWPYVALFFKKKNIQTISGKVSCPMVGFPPTVVNDLFFCFYSE